MNDSAKKPAFDLETDLTAPVGQTSDEEQLLTSLRAQVWDEFVGQEHVKESLRIGIAAAKQRQEPLDHLLLYGPPGLGKTTLSHLIAKEMGVNLRITSGTALAKAGDVAAIVTNLEAGDVLFIDEIHRLPKVVEETLYPAMEDFALDIIIGKGPSARTVRLDLPKFTLVGATTRYGALSGPFRDRFGLTHRMQHYLPPELTKILQKAAQKLGISLDEESAYKIGERARGTPRIALQLLKRVRDVAQVKYQGEITPQMVVEALEMLAVDGQGLSDHDRRFLSLVIEKHAGGPVGLSTIAATLSEDPGTIEEVLEPYLMQIGFLQKTPKGRVITPTAYGHLGIEYPEKK
jgi:holliday junction DNA helicase RuvB